MADPVAVIDIGKTRSKLVVVDGGRVLEQEQTPTPIVTAAPHAHVGVAALFEWICDALAPTARPHRLAPTVPAANGPTPRPPAPPGARRVPSQADETAGQG